MENKKAPKPSLISIIALCVLVLGSLIAIGGLLLPDGDLLALGLGLELQMIGLALILFKRK